MQQLTDIGAKGMALTDADPGGMPRDDAQTRRLFDGVADEIVRALAPRAVFDAGCGCGLLVEALWDRGVEAWGRDAAAGAIARVRRDVRPFCEIASVAEALPRSYDLVTCIEVLEHVPEDESVVAIRHFAAAAPRVLFSSPPNGLADPARVNVKPPIWWLRCFAAAGLSPSFTFNASFLFPWAVLFERRDDGREEGTLLGFAEMVRMRLERADLQRIARRSVLRAEEAERRLNVAELARSELRAKAGAAAAAEREAAARLALAEQTLAAHRTDAGALAVAANPATRWLPAPIRASLRSVVHLAQRRRGSVSDADLKLLRSSPLFDADYYRNQYPDVATAGTEPAQHYLASGAAEGRDPSAGFSTADYLELYPDVGLKGLNPLVHYLKYGRVEGRALSPPPPTIRQATATPASDVTSVMPRLDERWPALRPLICFSHPSAGRRLSVVTDSVGPSSLFGGVATALVLGTLLANRLGATLRLVTRVEATDGAPLAQLLNANGVALDGAFETAFAPADGGRDLPDTPDDFYVTTSWWTTQATLRSVARSRIMYVLQEDERMFYPHGDDRLRCAETLAERGFPVVVNTEMLFRHLTTGREALPRLAEDAIWFEPAFPAAPNRNVRWAGSGEMRRLFFYARPNHARNLFWLGVEALAAGIEAGTFGVDQWEFHWVGKDVPQIVLPHGVRPIVTEGLKWADYHALVRSMDAGLVLMDTPHPSYPLFDLAAAGAAVLTNMSHGKTDFSRFSDNILVAPVSVDGLASGLRRLAALGTDDAARHARCAADHITRDWSIALAPVLSRLAERFGVAG
jgi:Methyltransferase domain